MIKRLIFGLVFVAGLGYLILPGPTSINDFPPLPNSLKSTEPGDTYQNPNNAAYFSDERRSFVTNYYKEKFTVNIFGFKIPPIRLNHPPEAAYQYIRDQQMSTYLEEFTYPLRDSIYVNGFEPFDENGKRFNRGTSRIFLTKAEYPNIDTVVDTDLSKKTSIEEKIKGGRLDEGRYFESKTTLRFYKSSVFWRVLVYLAIWALGWWIYKLTKRTIRS